MSDTIHAYSLAFLRLTLIFCSPSSAAQQARPVELFDFELQGRGNRGGGNFPHNFATVGALPPTLDRKSRSFLFWFVFAREVRSLPKK